MYIIEITKPNPTEKEVLLKRDTWKETFSDASDAARVAASYKKRGYKLKLVLARQD